MPELSKEAVALLQYILPGLLAAWIFYGLTSHTKPPQLERVIQALIFTFLVQAVLPVVRWTLELIGAYFSLRPWDSTSETQTSVLVGALLGFLLAYLTNKDSFHAWIRKLGVTTRAAHPSEWHGVLSEKPRYVVLHLTDERRLAGYPKVWPSEPERGHFFIIQPSWLSDTGQHQLLHGIEGFLINTKDVKWVELLNELKEQATYDESSEVPATQANSNARACAEGPSERESIAERPAADGADCATATHPEEVTE